MSSFSSSNENSQYSPRAYKKVSEFSLEKNKNNDIVDINSLSVIDERVHSSTDGSEIVQFFKGKSIFLTGGTGFVGKLLTEKLLRTCKEIESIFVLVRHKKGKSPEDRLYETLSDKVFSELEKTQPKFRNKIVPITGDISLPELGINHKDRLLLIQKVNVIFHAAATVRFDEKLRLATSINVTGTRELMILAQQCHNLSSLVYVSTAFSNCPHKEIEEKIYDPPYSTEELLKIISTRSDRYLESYTKEILKEWPNTYTFTKAMAENTVKTMGEGLPVSVFRPGISGAGCVTYETKLPCLIQCWVSFAVDTQQLKSPNKDETAVFCFNLTSTYREPLKSWIDNLYGPMGAVVGVGTGVLRSFQCDPDKVADMVPGDYVINGIIAAAYKNHINKHGEFQIYNYVSSPENPLTWGDFQEISIYYGLQNPSIKSVWYCYNRMNKNYYIHLISIIFLHFIPAYFFDFYLTLKGKRPKVVKIYKKIHKFNTALSIFSTNEWKFKNDNTVQLWKGLNEIDKKLFGFSLAVDHFKWNDYLRILGGGVRLYLLKEDVSTIPAAIAKYKRLYYYHKILQAVCALIILVILFWILSPIFTNFF